MKEINATGSRFVIEAALKAINSKQNEIVTLIDMFGVLTMAPKSALGAIDRSTIISARESLIKILATYA